MLKTSAKVQNEKSLKKDRMHYAWWILTGCCAFIFVVLGIVNSCQGLFLMPVTADLGITSAQFSLVITLQGLMGIITMPIAGRVLPRYNIRIVLSVALIIYLGSFAGFSLVSSYFQFLLIGTVLGAAGGFLTFLPVAVLISNWFNEKQGFALGLAMAFTGIGGAIFNPVGSILIETFGWRSSYQILGLIGIIIALPVTLGVFRFKPSEVGLSPYGGKAYDDKEQLAGIRFNKVFRVLPFYLIIVWCIAIGSLGGVMYHIPAFINQLNYSSSFAGTVMSVFMLSMTAGKIILGHVNDRFWQYSCNRDFFHTINCRKFNFSISG